MQATHQQGFLSRVYQQLNKRSNQNKAKQAYAAMDVKDPNRKFSKEEIHLSSFLTYSQNREVGYTI